MALGAKCLTTVHHGGGGAQFCHVLLGYNPHVDQIVYETLRGGNIV